MNDEIMVWNLALTQLLCYISQFTNEISGNNITVYRFGVGNYIQNHIKCVALFGNQFFFKNVIIKISIAQDVSVRRPYYIILSY